MKLKVCGMKYQDNIKSVAKLRPDFLGFIFYNKSSRQFKNIIPKVSRSINKVGVFVNAELEYIMEMIKQHKLNMVQLHGDENPHFCASLKFMLHLKQEHWRQTVWEPNKERQGIDSYKHIKIIKMFPIKDTFNFNKLKPFEELVDYFLFDAQGELPGGNGYTFDWNILLNYPSSKPYFLSGGIGLGELQQLKIFKKSKASKYCFAIDVNSKFEIEPGLKHIKKLTQFKSQL